MRYHVLRPNSAPQPRQILAGFTLVELLVVIGILAVLIGILIPVLGKVRESASRTACAGQLRDIGMQLQMYLNDNKQRVPRVNPFPWAPDLLGYPAPTLVEVMQPYHRGATGVYRCPADRIINVLAIDADEDVAGRNNSPIANAVTYFDACGTSYEYNVFFNAFATIDEQTGINKVWRDALYDSEQRGRPADQLRVVFDLDPFHHKTKTDPKARNVLYADWHVGDNSSRRRRS